MSLVRRYVLGETVRAKLYSDIKKHGRLLALMQNPKKEFPIVDREYWAVADGHEVTNYIVYLCRKDKSRGLNHRTVEAMEQFVPDCGCKEATPLYNFLEKVYRDVKGLNKPPFRFASETEAFRDLEYLRETILSNIDNSFDDASEVYSILNLTCNDYTRIFDKEVKNINTEYEILIDTMLEDIHEDSVYDVVEFIREIPDRIEENLITKFRNSLVRVLHDSAIRDNNI